MKAIKFLNYFNLVVAVVFLGIYLKSTHLLYDYFFIACLGLIIWYNWVTLKVIMGQNNPMHRIHYSLGVVTIIFSFVLILGCLALTSKGFQNEKFHLFAGLMYIPLGITSIVFAGMTLKYHHATGEK